MVTAHIADRIDRNFVRILVGDRVRLELSPADVGAGGLSRSYDVARRMAQREGRKAMRSGVTGHDEGDRSNGFATSARSSGAAASCG
jgi:hypothetical protein